MIFFFKQKTAYEMRISDWSSDVCSSDLAARKALRRQIATALRADFERLYAANRDTGAYSPDAAPAGRRALKNSALAYLAALAEADAGLRVQLAAQYKAADNMTARLGDRKSVVAGKKV